MSHYETLISDEYWAGGIEPPTVGYIHDKLDAVSAAGFVVKNRIEGDYYHLKTAATRKLMVEEGEELPMPDAELKGYVQAVVDERFHGIVEPTHRVELADTIDNFDYFADRLLARDHIGFAALMHVRGDEGDTTIKRSVLFARPGLSGKQLVAVSSRSINNVSRDRDWRKQTVSEPRLILPRYLVGQVYSDTTKDGIKRDLRVRYAEHITQIPEVSDDGRPQGGKKTATLSWLVHQAGLSTGRA